MYIRWIVRGHKNTDTTDVTFHDAYLVESYRDDEGKPRRRTLSYLGNIRQMGDVFPGIERELFLFRAARTLSDLPELSALDAADVLNQLHQKVPPLTDDELKTGFINTVRWYFRRWADNDTAPSETELLRMIATAQQLPDSPTFND